MSNLKIALLWGGAGFEFLGIIILAAPDLLPYRDPILRWLDRSRALLDRRIRGVPPSPSVLSPDAVEIRLTGERASLIRGISVTATLEQQVEYLIERDREAQNQNNTLRDRIEDLEKESVRRVAEARDEIERLFRQEMAWALDAHRLLRIYGAVALLIGLFCVTVANFID